MGKGRLEAFSDGVIAVIITIMVLELKAPHGTDLAALAPVAPALLTYVLSFVYVGIYWNNHHHMLHAAQHIDGRVLWANLHLLFWLSLVPFTTGWVGEYPTAAIPRAIPLRLDVDPLRGDRDHDAFALWVLSSSERAVFKRDGRCCILGRVATGLQPVTSGM